MNPLDYAQPMRLVDEAMRDGKAAVQFDLRRHARDYALRLHRLLHARRQQDPEIYAGVMVKLSGSLVEIFDFAHPNAAEYVPPATKLRK